MKIRILAVAKTKDEYILSGEQEYMKRLLPSANIEWTYVKEEPITKSSDADAVMEREGERILKQIPDDYYVVALHLMGKELTSFEFAKLLEKNRDFEGGKICFIIGGPLGLSQTVLAKARVALSFSRMTFTHQMVRLLLLEQLYRGFEILRGSEYHK